jgi:hypothetical protein
MARKSLHNCPVRTFVVLRMAFYVTVFRNGLKESRLHRGSERCGRSSPNEYKRLG